MTWVRDILASKGETVFGVGPDDTVLDALELMATKNVGAVVVTEGDALVGIFTERQYAREVFLKGRASPSTKIRDVMVGEVVRVAPDTSVDDCMGLMTELRIRHLPVVSEGRLVGIVSIGDLMKSVIGDREFHIDELVKYVSR